MGCATAGPLGPNPCPRSRHPFARMTAAAIEFRRWDRPVPLMGIGEQSRDAEQHEHLDGVDSAQGTDRTKCRVSAVLAPMSRASVATATVVKPGFWRNCRMAKRRSFMVRQQR